MFNLKSENYYLGLWSIEGLGSSLSSGGDVYCLVWREPLGQFRAEDAPAFSATAKNSGSRNAS